MRTVGVRELRQDASSLLAWVEATGEAIEISNHGRPVARLMPFTSDRSARDELISTGALRPGVGNLLEVEPVVVDVGAVPTDEVLAAERDDR